MERKWVGSGEGQEEKMRGGRRGKGRENGRGQEEKMGGAERENGKGKERDRKRKWEAEGKSEGENRWGGDKIENKWVGGKKGKENMTRKQTNKYY